MKNKISNSLNQNILCITNKNNNDWALNNFPQLQTIINPFPENGMLSSVFCGIKFNEINPDGYLIIPVDLPFVKRETYNLLIKTFLENSDSIVKPQYKKNSGHPIIIPKTLINFITESGINNCLNEIIKKSKINKVIVETEDDGILKNINYPEDLI